MPQFNQSVEATEKYGFEMQSEMDKFALGTPSTSSTSTKFTYTHRSELPEQVDIMKRVGDDFMKSNSYSLAINQYTECIKLLPNHPMLYFKRAIAYKLRRFIGDSYFGLRDCQKALRLDPNFEQAHLIQMEVFNDLKFFMEASKCLDYMKKCFPNLAKCKRFQQLAERIEVSKSIFRNFPFIRIYVRL